jgi:predicted transcriptional regulator
MTKVITSVRVDDELWKKAKIHAIEKNETLTDMVERLLKEELERKQKEGIC